MQAMVSSHLGNFIRQVRLMVLGTHKAFEMFLHFKTVAAIQNDYLQ